MIRKKGIGTIVWILLLLLLVGTVAGCGGDGEEEQSTAVIEEETAYIDDHLPKTMDYGKNEVSIYWRNEENYAYELNGEAVNRALVERDGWVEERLNISFKHISADFLWENRGEYIDKIKTSVQAGDQDYMIVSGQYHVMPNLITTGALVNMVGTGYFDFDNPWWMKNLVKDTALKGKMYLAMGDYAISYTNEVSCVFFNESLLENTKNMTKTELYDIVYDGGWTYAKLLELIKDVYASDDGSGERKASNTYGLHVPSTYIANFLGGFEMDVVEKTEDDNLKVTINSERNGTIMDALLDLCYQNKDVYYSNVSDEVPMFSDGNLLFHLGVFCYAKNIILANEEALRWGILPFPKWDDVQSDYCSDIGNWYDFVGITNCGADTTMLSAVLECMSAYSYYETSKAIFEDQFQMRYAQDPETSGMYEFIRDHIIVNYGCAYGNIFSMVNQFTKLCVRKNESWTSYLNREIGAAEYYAQKFIKDYNKMLERGG